MKREKFAMRSALGTKKTKLKWRNIGPALLVGGVVSFVVWQIAAYCCALLQMTMPVLVWAFLDSVVFVVASMVAVVHINALATRKAVAQKIDWDKVQKFQTLSEIRRIGIPLVKLGLDAERIDALERMQIYTVEDLYGRLNVATTEVVAAIGITEGESHSFRVKVRNVLGPKCVAMLDSLAKEKYEFGCNE